MSNRNEMSNAAELAATRDPNQTSASRAWVLAVLQRRPDLLARMAYFHQRLRRLPRGQRRWLQRRVAMPLAAAALMLAMSAGPGAVLADSDATITVANSAVIKANDGVCSLIEAINNANATSGQPHADCAAGSASGTDTIVLPTNGMFSVDTYDNYGYYGYNGLPEISSAIIIEGNGSTIKRGGTDKYRLLSVIESGDLTLKNTTVTGGNPGYYYGGAMMVQEGKLTVANSTITGNTAEGGGAIYAINSNVTVTDSKLNGNTAYAGSAISAIYGQLTIANSEMKDNKGPGGFGGGAIYALGDGYDNTPSGNINISNTIISGNSNDGGGALMVTFGTLNLTNSTVSKNTTKEGYGAGVYLIGTTATISGATISGNTSTKYSGGGIGIFGGKVSVANSTIDANKAGYLGGGVYSIDADVTFNQTTISNNSTKKTGGGVMVYSGTVLLGNTTISGNDAETGGGLYNRGTTQVVNTTVSGNAAGAGGGAANIGTLSLVNATLTANDATAGSGGGVLNKEIPDFAGALVLQRALIAGNNANSAGPQVHSSGSAVTVTANSFNLLGSSGASGVVGFSAGATDIVPAVGVTAVLAGSLANNGGPTLTHALVEGSPALDAAPNGVCSISPVNGRDQRGAARNQDAGGGASENECDIGAYELGDDMSIGHLIFLPAAVRP